MPVCAECGMPIETATTYHPYAACLMFKACQNSDVVQANLDPVVFHGMELVSKDAMRYRWLREWGSGKRLEIFQNAGTRSELDALIDAAMLKTPNC